MPNFLSLSELLDIQKEYFFSDYRIRDLDNTIVFYVPVERVSEHVQDGFVSKQQLINLSKKIEEKYLKKVEFIYFNLEKSEKITDAIQTFLISKYKEITENIKFTFLSSTSVNAWLHFQGNDLGMKNQIEQEIANLFQSFGVTHVQFHWTSEAENLPSMMEILRVTKVSQPILLKEYLSKLFPNSNNEEASQKWINSQLDKLIKKKLMIRDSKTKKYSLTGLGLGLIPNILGKSNSDIVRALDLGRKEW